MDFKEQWDFPHILGALDGKHVAIECPKLCGSLYYNYKQFHSMVLMALCDSGYRFTFVDIGSYGGENDAAIFGRTKLFDDFENKTIKIPSPENIDGTEYPYVIVGDEIFPLKTWLMKPYGGSNLRHDQQVFNYRLSRARRTIENAFGILSARWRIFRRPIRANAETVERIIQAVVCLHNYLLSTENAGYKPNGFVDSVSDDGTIVYGTWRNELGVSEALRNVTRQGAGNYTNTAKETRDNFCTLVNTTHSLEYQDALVQSAGRILN